MEYTRKERLVTGTRVEDCTFTIGEQWTLVGPRGCIPLDIKVVEGEVRYRPSMAPDIKSTILAKGPEISIRGHFYLKAVGGPAKVTTYRMENVRIHGEDSTT
jgi:hypothetical protein